MLVADALREGLTADKEERVRTGASGMHAYASEAGGCARRVAYDLLAGRPGWTPTLTQEVAFRIGKDLEKAVAAAIAIKNPTAQGQVPWILDGGKISGIADAVYTEPEVDPLAVTSESQGLQELTDGSDEAVTPSRPLPGDLVVCEIKTMANNYFNVASRKGPEQHHILQAGMGARALGARWTHVIYVSKGAKSGDTPILEWLQPVDDAALDIAEEEMVMAVDAAIAGTVPPPWQMGDLIEHPIPKRPPCLWCPWIEECTALGVDSAGAWEDRLGKRNR